MAAVRLDRLKRESAVDIALAWKAYPLVPGSTSGRRFGSRGAQVWARAREEEPLIAFQPWPESRDLPSSSFPALEAAKCAELQDREAFESYHLALFRAFFEHCRDISSRDVVLSVAAEVGLDVARLAADLDRGEGKKRVGSDYKEIRQSGSFAGIPTAIFDQNLPLTGAVPIEVYRRAVETLLKRRVSDPPNDDLAPSP